MANTKYDIFISYRRDGGAQYARILQLLLLQRGYRVFLDYDELKDGVFGKRIKSAISEAPIFLLVLSKDALERCKNADDWVREEICFAIQQNKHIIPVNPDKSFTGIKADIPNEIKTAVLDTQHSEIDFGQSLGATIDLMINNRLVPTLGKRTPAQHTDEDMDAAQETLRRLDAHHRFMRILSIVVSLAILLVVGFTCYGFWRHNRSSEALEKKRTELHERHSNLLLQLNNSLSMEQMAAIDTMLTNLTPIYPDSIWMSQFEFTQGLWYDIKGEPCEAANRALPMTGVSYGEISLFLADLGELTNLYIELPSAEVWHYAAHGGQYNETTRYVGSDDVERVAWYSGNSDGHAHPSDGQQGLEPNILDLYDMSGNVAEICNTPFNENGLYTICGGSYADDADGVTADAIKGYDTDTRDATIGFRIIVRKIN